MPDPRKEITPQLNAETDSDRAIATEQCARSRSCRARTENAVTATPSVLHYHATAVAMGRRACLITGKSGSGKSTLAIAMIALGAELVADDRVEIRRADSRLLLSAPATIEGLIEARGAGILRLPARAEAPLALIVDLDQAPEGRLPEPVMTEILGVPVPILAGAGLAELASLVTVILRHGLPLSPDEPLP